MSEAASVYVKFIRPFSGYAVGAVGVFTVAEAASLIRHGRAVLAPADLVTAGEAAAAVAVEAPGEDAETETPAAVDLWGEAS